MARRLRENRSRRPRVPARLKLGKHRDDRDRARPVVTRTRHPTDARLTMSARPSRTSRARPSLARVARACALVAIAFAAIARAAPDADVSTDDVAADAPPSPARLLARKRVVEDLAIEGQNLTVTVSLTNAGDLEARKVKARDDGFSSADFELVTGKESLSASFASIASGETVEYSFVVVPKKSGSFVGGAASVSYQGTSGRETTHGTSNVVGAVAVYTKTQKNIFTALKIGRYLTLGACKTMEDWVKYGTLVGGVAGVLALNWFALKVKKGVAAARRKMAVASLERSDKREKAA